MFKNTESIYLFDPSRKQDFMLLKNMAVKLGAIPGRLRQTVKIGRNADNQIAELLAAEWLKICDSVQRSNYLQWLEETDQIPPGPCVCCGRRLHKFDDTRCKQCLKQEPIRELAIIA